MNTSRKLFVGPRVRRLRGQQGWNQATLAQRLSVSLSYVSQIENNQRPVSAVAKPNPSLLAGLRVRVGDDVFENSVAGQLATLAAHV